MGKKYLNKMKMQKMLVLSPPYFVDYFLLFTKIWPVLSQCDFNKEKSFLILFLADLIEEKRIFPNTIKHNFLYQKLFT